MVNENRRSWPPEDSLGIPHALVRWAPTRWRSRLTNSKTANAHRLLWVLRRDRGGGGWRGKWLARWRSRLAHGRVCQIYSDQIIREFRK
jgi:hypothetical protein